MKKLCFVICILSLMLLVSCGGLVERVDSSSLSTETDTVSEVETESETIQVTEEPEPPKFISPLTGLEIDEALADKRPVAIMINNIRAAMPQEGTSYADIIYECIVEGAQTRLLAVCLDYEQIPEVGSVRSSREYYLDFAANHDAIYVHAGGSEEAYRQIKARKVNNLDGVNMYLPDVFYRSPSRLKTHAYEHTLMTSGEKIKSGILYKKYRTELKEGFESPFVFPEFDEAIELNGEAAEYISVKYSNNHQPYFMYDDISAQYVRYQFGGIQSDNSNDTELSFENIILIYCPTYNTNDKYGHYNVNCIGEGSGYYFTAGKYVPITWKKPAASTPVSFYTESGDELVINRGKTFVQVCTDSMKETTVISAEYPSAQ